MRQILSIIIYFIGCSVSFCQNESFEGYIKYRTVSTSFVQYGDSIKAIIDTSYSTVYHKNDNFVDVPNEPNNIASKQIFLKDSCKIYYIPLSKKEPIIIYPGALQDTVLYFDSIPEKKEILGINCSGVIIKTENSIYRSYLSPQQITYSYDLSSCNYWNIDIIVNQIPLYTLIESKDNTFKIEIIAEKVASVKIRDKLFKLPKNRKYSHNN